MVVLVIIVILLITFSLSLAIYGSKVKEGMDPVSMYNIASCLVIASIISGVISFAAIWMALPSAENSGYTRQDVTVDILAVLTTILMGWNIISVVDFKRKVETVDAITNDVDHIVSGIMKLYMKSFMMRGDKVVLLDNCMTSLAEILECKNEDVSKHSIDEIMKLVNVICLTMEKDNNKVICKDRKHFYKHILNSINHEYKENCLKFVKKATEVEMEVSLTYVFDDFQNGDIEL